MVFTGNLDWLENLSRKKWRKLIDIKSDIQKWGNLVRWFFILYLNRSVALSSNFQFHLTVCFRIDPDTGQDQLAECMKRRLCFEDFHEQKIGFMPTYKFNPNSKIYDTSRALRQPSYTVWLIPYESSVKLFPILYSGPNIV